ncbi:MAG TPA: hypothetical protein VMB75_09325, partial [Rhodocyclaceae bacterium]|nr:hypothetical protein [Rhodocyclaceae bacterium]
SLQNAGMRFILSPVLHMRWLILLGLSVLGAQVAAGADARPAKPKEPSIFSSATEAAALHAAGASIAMSA